jgi:hypothetical protein
MWQPSVKISEICASTGGLELITLKCKNLILRIGRQILYFLTNVFRGACHTPNTSLSDGWVILKSNLGVFVSFYIVPTVTNQPEPTVPPGIK